MKIHRSIGYVHIDLSSSEAKFLLEELEHVRGGSRLPKVRQVCAELAVALSFEPLKKTEPAKLFSVPLALKQDANGVVTSATFPDGRTVLSGDELLLDTKTGKVVIKEGA